MTWFDRYEDAAAEQQKSGAAPADPMTQPIAEARAQQERYFASFAGTLPSVGSVVDEVVAGPHGRVPIRLVRPLSSKAKLPLLVFIRGAGFWAGSLDSHERTVRTLAELSGCAVCAVDYHRTPEHAWPVQRDDVLAALAWLRARRASLGLAESEPVLVGESAGATIALSVALALRDGAGPMPDVDRQMPVGLVLFYNNAGGPKATARPYSQWVWEQYLGRADASAVPGPVPLRQNLRGLPPVWLCCGDADPLMSDTLNLASRLAAVNVPHCVVRVPAMPHAFVMHSATLRPALDALKQAAEAARQFLAMPRHALKERP